MKKIGLLSLFSLIGIIAFASFPVEVQYLLTETDPEKFKLDTLGFILGILTIALMPYSLALLLVKKRILEGHWLGVGWLV